MDAQRTFVWRTVNCKGACLIVILSHKHSKRHTKIKYDKHKSASASGRCQKD